MESKKIYDFLIRKIKITPRALTARNIYLAIKDNAESFCLSFVFCIISSFLFFSINSLFLKASGKSREIIQDKKRDRSYLKFLVEKYFLDRELYSYYVEYIFMFILASVTIYVLFIEPSLDKRKDEDLSSEETKVEEDKAEEDKISVKNEENFLENNGESKTPVLER